MAPGPYLALPLAFINNFLLEHNPTLELKTSNLVLGWWGRGGE